MAAQCAQLWVKVHKDSKPELREIGTRRAMIREAVRIARASQPDGARGVWVLSRAKGKTIWQAGERP